MYIAGIDPGLSGAFAVLDQHGMPVSTGVLRTIEYKKRKLVDAVHLHTALLPFPGLTVIEDVSVRPGQGVTSSGNFMKATGTVFGVASIHGNVVWITPLQWKKFWNLLTQSKDASRTKAIEVFGKKSEHLFTPKRKHLTKRQAQDTAEAALIARWYVETRGKKVSGLLVGGKQTGLVEA